MHIYDGPIKREEVGQSVLFSATSNGSFAGSARLDLMERPELFGPKPQCYFANLSVSEEFRGNGLGGKLLDSALTEAKSRGYRYVLLAVDEDKEIAQHIYNERGFRILPGIRDGYDRMVMVLDLENRRPGFAAAHMGALARDLARVGVEA